MITQEPLVRKYFNLALVSTAVVWSSASIAVGEMYDVWKTSDDGSPHTLRWAISQANAHPGPDTIELSHWGSSIVLMSPLPDITESVSIASDEEWTIVGDGSFRLLQIDAGTVSIKRLSFTHGAAIGSAGSDESSLPGAPGSNGLGGAIYIRSGDVTLEEDIFEDNAAIGGAGGNSDSNMGGAGGDGLGGAIYVEGGSLNISGCTFRRNVSSRGEGGQGTVSGVDGVGKGGAIAIASGAMVASRKTYYDFGSDANIASDAGAERTDSNDVFGVASLPFPSLVDLKPIDIPLLDETAPDQGVTTAGQHHFTAVFDAPVTGVDATDFKVNYDGIGDAPHFTDVSGSGRIYELTLDTAEYEGRINSFWLVDDDTISSDWGTDSKLGGTGALNGDLMLKRNNDVFQVIVDSIPPKIASVKVQSSFEIDISLGGSYWTIPYDVPSADHFIISGSGKGTFNDHPDDVERLSDRAPWTYRLTWKSGQMANGGDVTITASDIFDTFGNGLDPAASSMTIVGGGFDATPPKLLVVVEQNQETVGVDQDVEYLIHLENIGVDFAEETLLSITHSENAEFVSLDLFKDSARAVKNVVVDGDSLSAELGAIDPSDDLLFTLKLHTTAAGPLSISASASSVSIIGEAADESGDLMVMEGSDNGNGNGNGNTPEEELTNLFGDALDIVTSNYCGTMGLMPLMLTAMLLFSGVRVSRQRRR